MGKILVVDDQPEILQLLRVKLEWKGHSVYCVSSGEQALKVVHVNVPDLIVLDLQMPGMNGLEVCHRLKESPKTRSIPVMIFTSHDSQENLIRSLEYHADWFCSKETSNFEKDIYPIIEALMKRVRSDSKKREKDLLHVGNFLTINVKQHTVLFYDRIISDMPRKLFDLLVVFARQPHSLLTREYVESRVWRQVKGENPVFDREVDTLICRLKKRLGKKAENLFRCAPGQGYQLLPDEISSSQEATESFAIKPTLHLRHS